MQIITLTTDFGLADWFVGTMKGIIVGVNPRGSIIDITHDISPGDIRAGAFALAASCRFFPKGTIHVAVVDPGVGSHRKAIAVQTANYFFVGPDNGVLSWALRQEKIKTIRALESKEYFLHPISSTFHGRDIFAPVAAHLARGVSISKLGPPLKEFVRLPWPQPARSRNRVAGEVIYIDHFGNGITNLDNKLLPESKQTSCEIQGNKRQWLCPLRSFYQAVPPKKPVAVMGSSGFLEIGVNGGSAEKLLGLKTGSRVVLARKAV